MSRVILNAMMTLFTINIRNSKTDQYRQGNEILVSKGHKSACKFDMYLRYIAFSEEFLFRPIVRLKGERTKSQVIQQSENLVGRLKSIATNTKMKWAAMGSPWGAHGLAAH